MFFFYINICRSLLDFCTALHQPVYCCLKASKLSKLCSSYTLIRRPVFFFLFTSCCCPRARLALADGRQHLCTAKRGCWAPRGSAGLRFGWIRAPRQKNWLSLIHKQALLHILPLSSVPETPLFIYGVCYIFTVFFFFSCPCRRGKKKRGKWRKKQLQGQ